MSNTSFIKILKYLFILLFILPIISSCRKDKEFVIKEKKVISKEKINSLKNIERRMLIWRNKKTFITLKKYLLAKEGYLKFSKNKLTDRIFLSKYYFYLSFFTNNKKYKIFALNKALLNAKNALEISSPKYKEGVDKDKQDYEIIKLIPSRYYKILYWYLNNLVYLRKEEECLALYRDDIENGFKYYHKIINNNTKLLPEIIFLYNIPKIIGGDKNRAIEELNKLKDNQEIDLFIKCIYLSKNIKEDLGKIKKNLDLTKFEGQVFMKIIDFYLKIKK